MLKKISIIFLVGIMLLSLFACGKNDDLKNDETENKQSTAEPAETEENSAERDAADQENTATEEKIGGNLVIYTATDEKNIERVIPGFEEKYGVKVEVIAGSAGEALSRIKAEKENPQADVMWGGLTAADYENDPSLWEPYVSANNDHYPEETRCKNGAFNNFMVQTVNLIVNKDLEQELGFEIKGYKDLLRPELKGKIINADPTSSSSAWRHLSTMLLVMGGYESAEAWDYVEKLIENLDGVTTTSSSAVYKQVAEGEYVVGLSYESACVDYLQSGADNIKLVFMEEGTTAAPFASAIIKDAKNMEQAKAFIDWLTSDEVQESYANEATSRPANLNFQSTNEYLPSFDEIKVVPEDVDYLNTHKTEIQDKWIELWVKHN